MIENCAREGDPVTDAQLFSDFDLPQQLIEQMAQNGLINPLPVQLAAIPPALEGKDLLIQAQTGSGKTLAYLLPLLARLAQAKEKVSLTTPYALIMVPTRELAQQVGLVFSQISTDIQAVTLIGGVSLKEQSRLLQRDARVIIATPGRLLDCLRQRLLSLKNCRFCVLDEVDEMFSMGFFESVQAILARLPRQRQGLFVSATISPRVAVVAQSFLRKPENIFVDRPDQDLPPIKHYLCRVASGATSKPEALCDLIETRRPKSCIIFCNTKSDTELVEAFLRRRGYDARRLNSDLSQKQREQIMDRIRRQELRFLVATDIAARGLDIEQIELVVNFALHDEPELYVHRTGRTGRAGKSGMALNLVGPQDFLALDRITKALKVNLEEIALPSAEELADAKLAHLYELLKESEAPLTTQDLLVAQKFIKEVLAIEDPEEESIEMLARFQHGFLQQALAAEISTLEEELSAETKGNHGKTRHSSQRGGQRNHNQTRGRDRSSRGGRQRNPRR